jgi:dihydroxyacetone kinase-like protein
LHVVKNYTGDVLNFQLAAELADDEGIKVETVLVDDDVAVQDSLYTAGRRGTGGTVVVEKAPARSPRPAPTSTRWPRSAAGPTRPAAASASR